MSYSCLSFLVTILTLGCAHSFRKVVAALLPQHVPSLPSQYSWTAGSQTRLLLIHSSHRHREGIKRVDPKSGGPATASGSISQIM
ncbi:uncharacterized protein LOC133927295 isoform X2 [Phragmites australis]|uniref:uncharacterized protein LOC133927295 isoform X2 n=1 Tax=Phragmites australis TaxID=29695 RepID=UPI002D782FCD|nr:uncharacterized protein LOC133927295 isoform X2 [Phragmites australis]